MHTTNKTRALATDEVLESADPAAYPTFPTGPDANGRVVFAGDLMGARIGSIRWKGSMSGFTAADLTIQHSDDGTAWHTLKAFTQVTSSPWDVEVTPLEGTDPQAKRFLRALLDMTGTPGTSTHTVEVHFSQDGPRGALAPPGFVDRPS